jgi:hypothetical protein
MSDDAEPPSATNPDHREAGREVKDFAKALRNGWPISDKYREASVETCIRILTESKSERNKIQAVKALALLNGQNLAAEMKLLDKEQPDKHEHNGTFELRDLLTEIRTNTNHADLERQRAIEDRD